MKPLKSIVPARVRAALSKITKRLREVDRPRTRRGCTTFLRLRKVAGRSSPHPQGLDPSPPVPGT